MHSNGRPYNITDLTPVFEGVKLDGEKIIDSRGAIVLDPRNGVFRYTFPQQVSTSEGEYQQAFFKLKRGEQTDSTLEVKLTVLKNMVEFGINSESYFTEYQEELNRLTRTVDEGIKELQQKSEATGAKIDGQVETAKALNLQLEAIKSAIGSNELVTKAEFATLKEEIESQVNTFISSIDTVKSDIQRQVREFGETKLDSTVVPGVLPDVAGITKTGTYYFNDTTANLPTRNGNNENGYIQAFMKDEENGMITMLGTGFAIEKYKGKLHDRWKTSLPVKLWSGKASKGQTMTLRGNCHQFGNLFLEVGYATNRNATETVQIPSNGNTFYMNTTGMMSSDGGYKNGHLEEIIITVKDDTHLVVKETLRATGNAKAVDSDAYISAVYGLY